MSTYELSAMLNISVSEVQDFIERCDRFDHYMESLYDLEAAERFDVGFDDLVENACWNFDWSDEGIDD